MVARKQGQRIRVRGKKLATKHDEGNDTKGSKNEVEPMEIDKPKEIVQKDKMHQVSKKMKKRRVRRKVKKHGMKLQVLSMLCTKQASITEDVANPRDDTLNKNCKKKISEKKRGNLASKELLATYRWEITLAGIPKTWKGDIEELTSNYKQFNLQAFSLARQLAEGKICQVLHLFFNSEEDMKNAVLCGQREFLGKTLTLRTNPPRMVYISGIPLDVNEETTFLDLKNALGSAVYDVSFPKNKEGRLLGYAVAYVIDEASQKELLDGRTENLWDKVQCLCSKDEFFKKFVLNVFTGWQTNSKIFSDILNVLEKMDVQVSGDTLSKKLFFLDEVSAKKVLKKSGMMVKNQKVLFGQSHSVRFVMKCITRHTTKDEILKLLEGIKTFKIQYNEKRCKATFDVPEEEVEKCHALHQTEFAGRKLEVYQCGSEELKSAKESSREKFKEYVIKNDIKFKKGHRLHDVVKLYRQLKDSKPSKIKKKRSKKAEAAK